MFQKNPIIAYKGIQIKNFFGIALKILFVEHIIFGFAECIISRFEVFAKGKWELFAKRLRLVKIHKANNLDASYFMELFLLII